MKIIKSFFILIIILHFQLDIKAQDDVMSLVKTIKVLFSDKSQVKRIFGEPNDALSLRTEDMETSFWYLRENETIVFTFSDGKCVDDLKAPKDTVIEIDLRFKNDLRRFSKLKNLLKRERIDINKLKVTTALDVEGERHYYDDEHGIRYDVDVTSDLWYGIGFYPSSNYYQFRCKE